MSDNKTEITPVPEKARPLSAQPAQRVPSVMGATFAERKAAREAAEKPAEKPADDDAEGKAVETAENKAVRTARSK